MVKFDSDLNSRFFFLMTNEGKNNKKNGLMISEYIPWNFHLHS